MKNIMVVDDEANILDQVKKCLNDEEFNIVTADNSRKAIELIDQDKENNFGLILINTKLPDSNSPAFFCLKPDTKKSIDTIQQDDFLKKPFTKQELQDFIRRKI